MCTVSMVGDAYARQWPPITTPQTVTTYIGGVSRAEFDALKAEVENLKKLLKLAKAMDAAAGTPDCEMDEKVALIRSVADAVGVDMADVFAAAVED